jgi:hypothetical protein
MNGGRNPDSEKPIIDTCPGGWEITDPTRSGSNSLLLKSGQAKISCGWATVYNQMPQGLWLKNGHYLVNKFRLSCKGYGANRSTARYIYSVKKHQVIDISIYASTEKCFINYFINTLYYKDLFLTIM